MVDLRVGCSLASRAAFLVLLCVSAAGLLALSASHLLDWLREAASLWPYRTAASSCLAAQVSHFVVLPDLWASSDGHGRLPVAHRAHLKLAVVLASTQQPARGPWRKSDGCLELACDAESTACLSAPACIH